MRGWCAASLLSCLAATGVWAEDPAWEYSASAYGYFVPHDSDYVQPTFTADRGVLHLEARYNYEDLETGSVWAGYNFALGDAVSFEVTPMLGAVFGQSGGVAPGYKATLGWRWLEAYSEGEYLFASDDRDESFFYSWSELTAYPVEWFRAGIVGQRTRAYDSDREIQRGLLVGFYVGKFGLGLHVFNPDDSDPLWVASASVEF